MNIMTKTFESELARFSLLQYTLRNRFELLKVDEEVNEDYNPRFASNGGAYYQPTIHEYYKGGYSYNIYDTSCGDFGDRYDVSIELNGKCIACYSINEVDRNYYEQVAVNFSGVTDSDYALRKKT